MGIFLGSFCYPTFFLLLLTDYGLNDDKVVDRTDCFQKGCNCLALGLCRLDIGNELSGKRYRSDFVIM